MRRQPVPAAVRVEEPLSVTTARDVVRHDLEIRSPGWGARGAELDVAAFERRATAGAALGSRLADGRALVADPGLGLPLAHETRENLDGFGRQIRAGVRGGRPDHKERRQERRSPEPAHLKSFAMQTLSGDSTYSPNGGMTSKPKRR